MKKSLAILFCITLLFGLLGCSSNKTEESAPSPTPKAILSEEPAPEPTPQSLNDMITAENEFNFTSDILFDRLSKEEAFESRHVFEYDDYIADWTKKRGTSFICFSKKAGGNVFAVLVVGGAMPNPLYENTYWQGIMDIADLCNTEFTSASEFMTSTGYDSLTNDQSGDTIANDVKIIYTKTIVDTYESGIVRFAPSNNTVDLASLPTTIEKAEREADFFNDETRLNSFNELNQNFQYADLASMVDSYIAQATPQETDSAYKIKELAEKAAAQMPNTIVKTDEFENNSSLYYKGVEKLSKDINIVPSVFGFSDVSIKIGFIASDWVFFDSYKIKVGEDDYVYSFIGSKTEDVLNNGSVLESSDIRLKWEDLEKIVNAPSPVIRFEGKEGKSLDHALSEKEISALGSLSVISQVQVELSEMRATWEQDF